MAAGLLSIPGLGGSQAPQAGTEAPQGSGLMASPQAGLPPVAADSPQATMALGQIAAKLLDQQKKTKYAQDLLRNFGVILGKVQSMVATEFQNPAAAGDLASIIHKLTTAVEKLGKVGPSQSPQLTTALADMVQPGGIGSRTV